MKIPNKVDAPATKGTLKANLQKKEFLNNNLKGGPTTPAPSEPEVPKAPTPSTPDEFNPPQDPTPVKESPSSMAKRTPGPISL